MKKSGLYGKVIGRWHKASVALQDKKQRRKKRIEAICLARSASASVNSPQC